jgi:hypothetical protein
MIKLEKSTIAILILAVAVAVTIYVYKKRQEEFSYISQEDEAQRADLDEGAYPLQEADIHECLYDPLVFLVICITSPIILSPSNSTN